MTAYFNGACVEKLVTSWFADLQTKASTGLSEISKEKVTRNAKLAGTVPAPKPPVLEKPKSDPKVTDKIGKISNLEGLEAYAKAAAYDKYKKDGGTKDLGGFLEEAKQKTNAGDAITKAEGSPIILAVDEDDPVEVIAADAVIGRGARFAFAMAEKDEDPNKGGGDPPPRPDDFSAFEPMGVWIADWSQLFPWICSAYCNDIPADSAARNLIRLKTLQQDCITLAKLYARFAVCVPVMGMDVNFEDISNSFSHGTASISDFLKASGNNPGSPASIDAFIKTTVARLSSSAQAIYKVWDANGCLRKAELGFGVMIRTLRDRTPSTIVKSGGPAAATWQLAQEKLNYPQRARNGFNPGSQNFDAFSSAVKGLPLILPDGRILLYLNFPNDEDCGIACLGSSDSYNILVAKSDDKMQFGLSFVRGIENLYGNSVYWRMDQFLIEAYPIPYQAANGVAKWLGCSVATGTGTLQAQLDSLRNVLVDRPKWSLDSDYWAGKAWSNSPRPPPVLCRPDSGPGQRDA